MQETKIQVEDLIRCIKITLEQQGFNVDSSKHKAIYRALTQFSKSGFGGEYSREIGAAFVESVREGKPEISAGTFKLYVAAVQRINRAMEGEESWDSREKFEYADSVYQKEVSEYEEYLRKGGKAKKDIRSRVYTVAKFLRHVEQSGVLKLSELTARHVYHAFREASNKKVFRIAVCAFLKYAYRYSLTPQDTSIWVPSVSDHKTVASVYAPEEVELIIEYSAGSKVCGKRNYAIVLIAARLGLRSCDIVNLRFSNIHQDRKTVEIVQLKNGEPIVLPLLPEIHAALNDYIANERPKSDLDRIFLRAVPPFGKELQPHAIYSIVSRIIQASGIPAKGRRRGAHALRASLATALIDEGNNYREVQEALGHRSPNSTMSYIKTDIKHLRGYALPVPSPGGTFAENLRWRVEA